MKNSEIITAIIAVYGAALSTVAIIRQWRNDRVKVKLAVNRNREIVGDLRYQGTILTEIKITNIGHRPVTITAFGAICLHPHLSLAGVDSRPQLPAEIREGQFISSYWPQAELDFSKIDYWAAWDSHDRVYKLPEASRFKHWQSVLLQKWEWRKKRKLRK